ncbi:hypothetical protein ACFU6I_15790 [Streptomyces sp. NPDC057486]|uniref:hypothetical protein n=1 Tax=Streptomyces sp. NPDC057486 TaxID=3346145 RepID=UPI00367A6549
MASRKKHRSRPARRLVAFIDADFAKGGRVTRHQHTKGPESWLVERIGIVWARADDRSLTWIRDELIDGPYAAPQTLTALEQADLVVGHGLLQGDLRAVAMITPLPDALVDRCVDTLVELHEARGGQWTTGVGLSELSWHTLRVRRAEHGNGPFGMTRGRGDHDPRDDARLHARLWQHLRTRATFTAPARRFTPTPVTTPLDETARTRIAGRETLGAAEWHRRRLGPGTIHAQGGGDWAAAGLAQAAAANLTDDHTPLRACATELLGAHDPLPGPAVLLGAFQLLGPGASLKARKALSGNHFARSAERLTAYTDALWKVLHPDARRQWAAAQPVFDPMARTVDFTAQQAAQEERRQAYRAVTAAAARVHQAYRG